MMCVRETSCRLGGEGKVVEIDEAKLGKRKYKRGRVIDGQWIFGEIDRGSKRIFYVPVPNRTKETLLRLIQDWIAPGTTIMSDCWRMYDCLEDEGFRRLTVNHSVNFVDPDTGAHTKNIERSWRNHREGVPKYGRRENHFDGYLAAYLFFQMYPEFAIRYHHLFRYIVTMYPPHAEAADASEDKSCESEDDEAEVMAD